MDYLTEFDWHTVRIKNYSGILYFRAPDHPLARRKGCWGGRVNLGRHIVSVKIGRWLTRSEVIQYKDGNHLNVDVENLQVKNRKVKNGVDRQARAQVFRLNSDELLNLVWQYLPEDIARMLNVSRRFIYHQCKAMQVLLPPHRYWSFIKIVKSRSVALKLLGWSNDSIIVLSEKLGDPILEINNSDIDPYPPDTDYMTNFDWRTAAVKNVGGWIFFYAPAHPLASINVENFGWVYLARHIASVCRGAWLTKDDCILYKDRHRQNIDPENLLVVTKLHEHAAGKRWSQFKFSSGEIWNLAWRHPRPEMARMLGITVNTVARCCKRLGILTPPPGYWMLVNKPCGMSPMNALTRLGWQGDVLTVLCENVDNLFRDEDVLDLPAIDYLKDFDWHSAEIKSAPRGLFFIAHKHPLAQKTGEVRLVRHIASVKRGTWLESGEVINYKDGNYQNIDPDNLLVVKRGSNRKSSSVELVCPVCGKSFKVFASRARESVTDKLECKRILSRKRHYTVDELWDALWKYPQRDVARMFQTAKKIVRIRCRELEVVTPPMGYWNLIQAGRSREEALVSLGWQAEQIDYVNSMLTTIQVSARLAAVAG